MKYLFIHEHYSDCLLTECILLYVLQTIKHKQTDEKECIVV